MDPFCVFVYIYLLSVYFFNFFYYNTTSVWNMIPVIFLYPSTRKELFSALAANKVGLKESFANILSFR